MSPLNNDYARPVQTQLSTGWIGDANTWVYVSADGPTFVASVDADVTEYISPGMRLRVMQTTYQYFIVTAVGSYSGGATLVTMYGGTDYTLADETITSISFANAKAPIGFPVSPEKWTETFSTTSYFEKVGPTNDVWYDTGFSLDVPIGVWHVSYDTVAWTGGGDQIKTTLSTTTSSETNVQLSDGFAAIGATGVLKDVSAFYVYELSSKTTFYLLILTTNSGAIVVRTYDIVLIRAVCAYL